MEKIGKELIQSNPIQSNPIQSNFYAFLGDEGLSLFACSVLSFSRNKTAPGTAMPDAAYNAEHQKDETPLFRAEGSVARRLYCTERR
jgi:hypothetical protein